MAYLEKESDLWKELASLAKDEGLFLYDVERFANSGLRVLVSKEGEQDSDSPKESVTSGDCSRFCKRLMIHFSVDAESFGLASEPEIEVSSPGVNRSLRTSEQFQGAVGERIKVVWQESLEDAPTNTTVGVLREFSKGELSVLDEQSGEPQSVVFEHVRKAHVDFPF